MVDFTLSDEQLALRELAHDFAEKEIRPVAWEYDREGTFPQAIIEKAWALGMMNTHIPEAYGGAGIGYLDGAIGDEDARGPQGRPLRDQRLEVLHHQRRLRELLHRVREDRSAGRSPRDLVLRRAARPRRDR